MADDQPVEHAPAKFHVHVDAIIRRDDAILIMKRAMGSMTGAWYFAGGTLEEDESPEEGVRREINEETGLDVDNLRLFRVWDYHQDESTPAVGITFVCDVPEDAEPRINKEHAAARWVTPEYYRERFLNDAVLAAIADNPIALRLVAGVQSVVDAYIAEAGA